MNIIGIGGYSHDSAAALLQDGRIVAAVAEERLTRVKHQGGIPERAVQFCLDRAGLRREDVDHVTGYMRPGLRVCRRIPYRATQAFRSPVYSAAFAGYELWHNAQYMRGMRAITGPKARLHYMEHHPAHAASAFLASPHERAALLSIDYVGEWAATWAGAGEGTNMRCLHQENYPNSLGVFYSALTDYLGFLRASDEYKVMGLASYGEPEYYDDFKAILQAHGEAWYRFDHSWTQWHYLPGSRCGYFSPRFIARFGPARKKDEPIEARHRNIAASAQRLLEDTVLRMCGWLREKTGAKNLCLAGGVALNCSMNGRIKRESGFENIWVQPASGDDGIAIGGALQLYHQLTGAPRSYVMESALLGPTWSDAAILACVERAKLRTERPGNVEQRTAELLAEGKIVGWFQGAMEFGPRALGARSILADPTRADMKDLVNKHVKFREEFRPFAPSVLQERAHEYFDGCIESPFMLFVYPVRPEKRGVLPAITHVDGTARVQTVSRAGNPRYYGMIEAFERLRGAPVVLNTSFNVMGEPIVNSPEDAVRCFYSTGMDALVLGDHVLLK
ncbi:MAG: carbamoyltransferase [Candidatus Hydrogenedentes bacterium]|nr:carbamoyltransferase [Candidatus Hydrogenedentota bacterium]